MYVSWPSRRSILGFCIPWTIQQVGGYPPNSAIFKSFSGIHARGTPQPQTKGVRWAGQKKKNCRDRGVNLGAVIYTSYLASFKKPRPSWHEPAHWIMTSRSWFELNLEMMQCCRPVNEIRCKLDLFFLKSSEYSSRCARQRNGRASAWETFVGGYLATWASVKFNFGPVSLCLLGLNRSHPHTRGECAS
jgi:hypothetical protein